MAQARTSLASFACIASLACVAPLALGGCGGDAAPSAPSATSAIPSSDAGPSDASPALPTVTFQPCDLHTEGGGPQAECAEVQMPLRREDPGGETIGWFVKRYRPAGGTGRKQLWFLQGGPGASGVVFEPLVQALGKLAPDVDFYMPDHRGTGRSTRLDCPEQEAEESPYGFHVIPSEWAACRAWVQERWGEDLGAFSTTNAANDVGLAIAATREPGQEVFVYGVSYGTYWAQRYMQVFPDQATGVILDSLVGPGFSLSDQDLDMDLTAQKLAAQCAADATCAAGFGPDPWARAHALYAKIDEGHCPSLGELGPPRVLLRRALGQMLMSASARTLVWPALARAERCDEDDQAALRQLLEAHFGGEPGEVPLFARHYSFVLANNIAFSELWTTEPITKKTLADIRDRAIMSRDVTEQLQLHMGLWPTYPKDGFVGVLAKPQVPMLMMNGTLDPATTIERVRPFVTGLTGPGRTFVEIPDGTHGLVGNSPTKSGPSCGTQLLLSFLASPGGALDASCLGDLAPIDFEGDSATAKALLGTETAWP